MFEDVITGLDCTNIVIIWSHLTDCATLTKISSTEWMDDRCLESQWLAYDTEALRGVYYNVMKWDEFAHW